MKYLAKIISPMILKIFSTLTFEVIKGNTL